MRTKPKLPFPKVARIYGDEVGSVHISNNFLHHPLFTTSKKMLRGNNKGELIEKHWKSESAKIIFTIEYNKGAPTVWDQRFWYYMLHLFQQERCGGGLKLTDEFKRYKAQVNPTGGTKFIPNYRDPYRILLPKLRPMAQAMGINVINGYDSQKFRARVEQSLERWINCLIQFEGSYYDKTEGETISWGMSKGLVIGYKIEKRIKSRLNRFTVSLNPEYMRATADQPDYVTTLALADMIGFQLSQSVRVYELLMAFYPIGLSTPSNTITAFDGIKYGLQKPTSTQHLTGYFIGLKNLIEKMGGDVDTVLKTARSKNHFIHNVLDSVEEVSFAIRGVHGDFERKRSLFRFWL